jgi:hypothetical protein
MPVSRPCAPPTRPPHQPPWLPSSVMGLRPHRPYRPFSFGLAINCSINSEYANPQYRSMFT